MGFREAWQERRAQVAVHLQKVGVQVREQWYGHRVWVWADPPGYVGSGLPGWQYGEVVTVDDRGWVEVLYDYTEWGEPVFRRVTFEDLGRLVVLAE